MKIGKYEIQEELGHGSMGVVYRARDTLLDRFVAIKVISTSALDDWSKTLFEREAKAVARMSHPNIIVVHDFDYFENQAYIVMELLKGSNLEELAQQKPLPLINRLEIVYDVLNGLEHAHQQGVIHRDIKPTNIFVTDSNVVKIMDFGIARLATTTSTASKGFVLGTPDYMSPEQVKAETLDGRTDLFSVGTMLYWLLAEDTPFSADTAESTMYKVVNEEPPPIHIAGISQHSWGALQSILNRSLAKDPADRFPSASEMAKEMKKLLTAMEQEPLAEDMDLESAETVQVSIKKFSTVKKQMDTEKPAAVVVQPPTKPADVPIEPTDRTMQLQGQKTTRAPIPHAPVDLPPTAAIHRFSKRNIAIALILLLAATWGIYRVLVARMIPARTPMIAPAAAAVELNLACGTEKTRWAEHFINRFSKTSAGKNIRLRIGAEMSGNAHGSIFTQAKHYQVWWPPSELEANLLTSDQKKFIPSTHKELALTPMVFVMWKERYDAFLKRYKAVNFMTISRALQQETGWKSIGGNPGWGRFTFGFSDPLFTNSGSVMLLLMTHEYFDKNSSLTIADLQDPGLKKFLSGVKNRGKRLNGSDRDLIEEMIRKGPASYDMAFLYENLAIDYLKDAQGRWGNYQIVYPTYNYWNENPFYILNSSWVTPEQKKSANAFQDFLAGPDVQKDSLQYGFRPALTSIPIQIPGSPFVEHKDLGFRADIGAEIEDSEPDVVKALLELWQTL